MNIYSLKQKAERQRLANHGVNVAKPTVAKEGQYVYTLSFNMDGRTFFLELTLPEIQAIKHDLERATKLTIAVKKDELKSANRIEPSLAV